MLSVAAIAQLLGNVRAADAELRLASIRELTVIAGALGPDRTRLELIPFICESMDEEDEVLEALAVELQKFVPLVGGSRHAHCLLLPYEGLAAAEESIVRDKAVAGLNDIVVQMDAAAVYEKYVPVVERMAKGAWFTVRTAAAGLYPALFPLINEEMQIRLATLYRTFVDDATPMVRRSAALHLKALIPVVSKKVLYSIIHPMFERLAKDEQDSVRLLGVDLCAPLAKAMTPSEIELYVLPIFRNAIEDKSWRVRYMIADHFTDFQAIVGPKIVKSELLPAFVNLLSDSEPEVRTALAAKIDEFSRNLPADIQTDALIRTVLPKIKALVKDPNQYVRASLASVIMGLSSILGKPLTIEHLLPLFLQLLKDEFSDVRLNIISHLDDVNKVIGISQLSQSLLPAIHELANDPSWRVRLRIIEYIPLVSKQLGYEFFNKELCVLCLGWLKDRIYAVRHAAVLNLRNIVNIFGVPWAKAHLFLKVLEMTQSKNFVDRLSTLFCINILAPLCAKDAIVPFFLPAIATLTLDPVPNIRFNCAKSLEEILPQVDRSIFVQHIKPVLETLVVDKDGDCKYFAGRALTRGLQLFG